MIQDTMIGGASVEETLTLWASSLRDAKRRLRPLFTQERVADSAAQFLDGLLFSPEPRKTGWMRAGAAGDRVPWRQQAVLGSRGRWDGDALRDIVREYALETLGDEDAVLVIDETGFLKQGKASCGVARQYTGSAGKITNCQIGVACHLCLASRSCLYRPVTVFAQGLDGQSRALEGSTCAARRGVRNEAQDRATHDRARDRRQGAILLRGGRQRLAVPERSKLGFVRPARAMSWAWLPITCSTRGARSCLSPVRPLRSRKASPTRPGGAYRPVQEPKRPRWHDWAQSSLNWPISRLMNTATLLPATGRGGLDPPQHRRRRSRLLL